MMQKLNIAVWLGTAGVVALAGCAGPLDRYGYEDGGEGGVGAGLREAVAAEYRRPLLSSTSSAEQREAGEVVELGAEQAGAPEQQNARGEEERTVTREASDVEARLSGDGWRS